MKSLEKISAFAKIGTSIVKNAKESGKLKNAKLTVKEDLEGLKKSDFPKKFAKDMLKQQVARVGSIKVMLNSDESQFIKTAVKESEPVKKITNKVETISDMVPERLKIEILNYKHWCINWFNISAMGLKDPIAVTSGMLKYTWLFDMMKANSMATTYVEGRSGANVKQVQIQTSYMIKSMCDMFLNALQHPDEVILTQAYMLPKEVLIAMDLENVVSELPGTILAKLDQYTGVRYLDAAENAGLPSDTCGLPRMTTGVSLLGEIPMAKCIVCSNLPCDGGFSSYETIQEKLGNVPIYRMSASYDFRNDDAIEPFVEDLKGMIKFLQDNTGHTMDWNKLKDACENYNEMVEYEIERWELAKLDDAPICNDAIALPHLWSFNCISGLPETTKHHKRLTEIAKKDYKKGKICFPNFRYRTIVWNPWPASYGHLPGWLERCWGIGSMMDLDTYGDMSYIDTSSVDLMLQGLSKRYMWATMSRHTRGPAENMLGDLARVIKDYKVDFMLLPAHVGCKNSMSLEAAMRDTCKQNGVPMCTFRYEFLDSRVTSRQGIRNQINKFMTEVMHAEPIDASLLYIDDGEEGDW